MKVPQRIEYLSEYLHQSVLSSKNSTAPTLLKGPEGSGKSWIINLLHSRLEKTESLITVWIPYRLSGRNLVSNISSAIELEESRLAQKNVALNEIRKRKVVLFLDRIDRMFNLTGRERQTELPKKAKGRAASFMSQILHAAELRSFLIERRDRVSIICTSEVDTRFMDDPDLPFFNFFNVIEVKPLSPHESRDFLISKISHSPRAVEVFKLIESFSVNTTDILTQGLISHINLLAGALLDAGENQRKSKADIKLIDQTLNQFFHQASPSIENDISLLSYSERALIDEIIRLPYQFRIRNINLPKKGLSKLILNLRQKGFIEPATPNSTLYYKLSSSLLRSWLRYKVFRRPEEALK